MPDDGGLFGPDISDEPREPVVADDRFDVWAWQHCNRWVFLAHQRPAALKELRELIATLRHAVCTLIAWIGASAGSPLSANDCRTLIAMAESKGGDQ